jgi:hypothetical protein
MVRAAARMAEAELARTLLTRQEPAYAEPTSALAVGIELLGRNDALVTIRAGHHGRAQRIRLSPRHSEVLLLLACAPRGLSGDELAVLLYEDDAASSTLRAQMNRLRSLLGDELLTSRPYRLVASVTGDWLAVQARLAAGDVAGALHAYRGPLLPRSSAPGVMRLREELEASVRHAVLRSGVADLMSAWTRSGWGRDDYEMWAAQAEVLGPGSPLLPLVQGQIARLDRELGL